MITASEPRTRILGRITWTSINRTPPVCCMLGLGILRSNRCFGYASIFIAMAVNQCFSQGTLNAVCSRDDAAISKPIAEIVHKFLMFLPGSSLRASWMNCLYVKLLQSRLRLRTNLIGNTDWEPTAPLADALWQRSSEATTR